MKSTGSIVRKKGRGIGGWLQAIAQTIVDPPKDQPQGGAALPPQGRRSGRGAESLAPFLVEGRNSRPAELE